MQSFPPDSAAAVYLPSHPLHFLKVPRISEPFLWLCGDGLHTRTVLFPFARPRLCMDFQTGPTHFSKGGFDRLPHQFLFHQSRLHVPNQPDNPHSSRSTCQYPLPPSRLFPLPLFCPHRIRDSPSHRRLPNPKSQYRQIPSLFSILLSSAKDFLWKARHSRY